VEEASFHDDENDGRHYIDLNEDVSSGLITPFSVSLTDLKKFQSRFDSLYISQIDPGELEALAYLCGSSEQFKISSGDAIVYRVLTQLNMADRGISLEEILTQVGLQRTKVAWPYTKSFREKYGQEGFKDLMQGRGLR